MHYKHLHTIISFCYRIKNDKKISQIQWHRTACRECWPGNTGALWPSTHQPHLGTRAKHLLLQRPVILLTSKLPNICTHIHEYNIQKCSKVIWQIRNVPTNNRCRSWCWKWVTWAPGCSTASGGCWQHPLAAGHTAPGQGRWGFPHGINVAVLQLQATSAPHQNNLTREGECNQKLWTHKNNLHETCLGHSSTSTASQCYRDTHQVTRE